MANDITRNPWILDSTGTVVNTYTVYVSKIIWSGMTANASVNLVDAATKTMFAQDQFWGSLS